MAMQVGLIMSYPQILFRATSARGSKPKVLIPVAHQMRCGRSGFDCCEIDLG
jgi:hypothetical protein